MTDASHDQDPGDRDSTVQDSGAAFADALGEAAGGEVDTGGLAHLARLAAASARSAGAGALASGRWLAGVALDVAARIPLRDLPTLQAHHGGLSGAALAGALTRNAGRSSAAVGAAAGAVVAAEELAPPTWVAIPAELVVETLLIAAIEMKLVAELHAVYGHPLPASPAARGLALARAWAERRGITPEVLTAPGGLAVAMGTAARRQVVRLVRRRLTARLGRNLTTLAPLLAGAVAAAEVNRRATVALGGDVVRDLAARRAARPA